MISTTATRIWTPYGYLFAEDLYIGEKVISYNADRGACEYDTVGSIQIEYKQCMGYGIASKTMRQTLTPDHDILILNRKTKSLCREPVDSVFGSPFNAGKDKAVLSAALFEPYRRTQDMEDIKWSARMAATISNHKKAYFDIPRDLGGYEAQEWLDTFFHWNKMISARNWMAAVRLTNLVVRDSILDIAPRAGVGAIWQSAYKGKPTMLMTTNGYVSPSLNNGWYKKPIDGLVFNLSTKNGNVLVKSNNGTYLVACEYTGE